MPVIKSAKKKLRKDKKRTIQNENFKIQLSKIIKKAKKEISKKSLQEAFRALDKSAKRGIMYKNKANRLKSRLSKLLNVKSSKTSKSKTS